MRAWNPRPKGSASEAWGVIRPGSEILYWRTVRGHEVDFVIETADRLLPIEVKTSRTLGKNDLRGVTAFLKEYPEITPFAAVIYRGSDWYRPARDVIAIPWSALLAH